MYRKIEDFLSTLVEVGVGVDVGRCGSKGLLIMGAVVSILLFLLHNWLGMAVRTIVINSYQ